MLLILTNSQDATADYLQPILIANNVDVLRLNTDFVLQEIVISYTCGDSSIRHRGCVYRPSQFTNIWYRRPDRLESPRFGDRPETQYALNEWAEALEGFLAHIPTSQWMNHPTANAVASYKIEQLTTARSIGLRIPDSIVTQDIAKLRGFFNDHDGRIVVKPMSSGYVERPKGQRDTIIFTNRVEPAHLDDPSDIAECPAFFQQYIDKRSDVRITFVDGEWHAVELLASDSDGAQRCDIRRNNMLDVRYRDTEVPDDVVEQLRVLLQHYGLRFGAVDMVVDSNWDWYFLEINANGQWAWLDQVGATNIAQSFVAAFT